MKPPPARLLNANEIISADALYARLEQQAASLNGADFALDFLAVSQEAAVANDADLRARLAMESSCQDVSLSGWCLTHFNPWKDPVAAEAYLQGRLAATQNDMLRLRYSLLMLLGLPKGRHTGQLAKEVVEIMQRWLKADQGVRDATQDDYYSLVQLAFLLSRQYKHEHEAITQLILDQLLSSKQRISLQWRQLSFFGEHASMLSKGVCLALDAVSDRVYAHYSTKGGILVGMVCDSAQQLAARAGKDVRKWPSLKGDSLKAEGIKRHRATPTDFVVQRLFTDAARCYRAAGNKQALQETEALISATKHDVRLNTVELDIPIKGLAGKWTAMYVKQAPAWVLQGKGNELFMRLLFGGLVPAAPEKRDVANPLMPFSRVVFDGNRNVTTRQEKKGGQTLPISEYAFRLHFFRSMTLTVFLEGLANGQLTYETTIEFLREHTWLREEFVRDSGDGEVSYTLIPLVEPALRHYFNEMQRVAANESSEPEMMLCIDSLTLKIEGLLRYYCRCTQPPLPTNRTGATGDQQEMTLEEIILSLEPYLETDSSYFLRYILTKEGWNIRNKVAHGFLLTPDYTPGLMQMVLVALFMVAAMRIELPEK